MLKGLSSDYIDCVCAREENFDMEVYTMISKYSDDNMVAYCLKIIRYN